MFASSKSGAVADPTDNKFNYVTMLLHGNGSNGSQNNTFVGGVNIYFDPWQYMFTDGAPVKDEWVADNGSGNIWDIMQPLVYIIVYLTLLFVIIRRLTGLSWGSGDYTTTETASETVSTSAKLPDGARKSFTHSITKRRKL